MIWLILSALLSVSTIGFAYLIKKEKAKQKELRNNHYQEITAIKELQRASMEAAVAAYDENMLALNESYKREIETLTIENEDIRRNYRNQGEIITHQILENVKSHFVEKRIISPDEMIVMPNIFIPGENHHNHQIDHLVLLPTGIYIIETVHWKGHIVTGLRRNVSHRLSFLGELLDSKKEMTLVFDKTESGELTVKTYEDPLGQVQELAVILSDYLKSKEIKTWINTVVFFNYSRSELHDWSDNSIVRRFTNKEQLHHFILNELTSKKRIYGAFQLNTIKHLIQSANFHL